MYSKTKKTTYKKNLFQPTNLYVSNPGGLLDAFEGLLVHGDDLLLFPSQPGAAVQDLAALLIRLHHRPLRNEAARSVRKCDPLLS